MRQVTTAGHRASEQVPPDQLAAVRDAKQGDALAPVTVVTPSAYASLFVRRSLALAPLAAGQDGTVGVDAMTLGELVRSLGAPLLASRCLSTASAAVESEAVRAEALATDGWLARLAGHRRSLDELEGSLRELRRCPEEVLDSLALAGDRGRALVGLLRATKRRLHSRGFADEPDGVGAALDAARSGGGGVGELGTVLTWHLGRCLPSEAEILRLLGARPAVSGEGAGSEPAFCEVRPCADPDEEGRVAARAIVEAAEKGVALWLQAILHPPRRGYARVLLQHLHAAGIPADAPGARRLDRCAASRTLLGLLDLAGGDWERDRVAGWLSSCPVSTAGRFVPAGRWDALSAAAGVVRGAAQWRSRLDRHAEVHAADGDEARALSGFVADLVSATASPGHTWAEFAQWAARLLEEYSDPRLPEAWPPEEAAARARLLGVVESLGELDGISEERADLDTFRLTLGLLLERTSLGNGDPAESFPDGVLVADYGISRGLTFDQVVVCGLADSMVPGPPAVDPLLDGELSASDTSGTLRDAAGRRAELLDELSSAVRAGAARRVATWPRCDPGIGRIQKPSRWLQHFAQQGTPWREVGSFAAAIAGDGPVISRAELELRTLDRWVSCGGEVRLSPVANSDPRLAAGLEAIEARGGAEFTRFDGSAGAGSVSPFDPDTPLSATRLETYAHCPRRFMFERCLRFSRRVLPEVLWRIEPAERGSLVHSILEHYVSERIQGAPRSLERLLAVAAEHLDEAEAGGLVGKPLLWQLDRATIVRELRRFHREEGDLEPVSVELFFGSDPDGAPPVTLVLEDGREVRFRGSVDRVDRTPLGHLVVSDYKTGRQGKLAALLRDPVASGTLLQLPLYAMAADARFGNGDGDPVHARYWLLSSDRSAPSYHLVVTEEVTRRFRQIVGRIASGVDAGCFPGVPGAAQHDGRLENCARCDFDSVCPPSRDRQWSRKLSDPKLRPVMRLLHEDVPGTLVGAVTKGFVDPGPHDRQHRGRA